jgi:rhomboid protease GluP
MNSCNKCRAFFPVDAKVCPHCGTSVVPKKLREEGGIFDRILPAGFGMTASIIAANFLAFGAMLLVQGGPAKGGILRVLGGTVDNFGGLWAPNVVQLNEYYRLVCPIFLHWDLIHIGFNCFVIWQLGRVAEFAYGPAKYLVLYLVSGLVASVASLVWHLDAPVLSAGASGAAFGLFGLVGVFAWRRGLDAIKRSVIQWTLINLVFGYIHPQIDNAAHVGGLIAGVALGFLVREAVYTRLRPVAVRAWDAGAVISILVVLASFGFALVGSGVLGGG